MALGAAFAGGLAVFGVGLLAIVDFKGALTVGFDTCLIDGFAPGFAVCLLAALVRGLAGARACAAADLCAGFVPCTAFLFTVGLAASEGFLTAVAGLGKGFWRAFGVSLGIDLMLALVIVSHAVDEALLRTPETLAVVGIDINEGSLEAIDGAVEDGTVAVLAAGGRLACVFVEFLRELRPGS